jgi:hypothetical protein
MKFNIEQTISNFVESQFPEFYLAEGPNFVLFVKAYYEWMESEGQAIQQARSIFDLRDIDNTLTDFLAHFQEKYLYGIPFNVIINKRFLLKHILDVYRSKGSINCYRLLFKLIYDQEVDIYLPGNDLMKASDGTWVEPKYLEVTNIPGLQNYVGQTVVGASSNTTAVIESYITQPINQNIVATLYFSNMMPKGGSFFKDEKIVIQGQLSNAAAVTAAPTVIGSLNTLKIINGGQSFNIGDVIKIAHYNSNNSVISHGTDGLLRVTGLSRGQGELNFNIAYSGFGFTANSTLFLYRGAGDNTGINASFTVGNYSYTKSIQYNTDLIVDYANVSLNATSYGIIGNTSANDASTIQSALSFTNSIFGSIGSLTNILTGSGYTNSAYVFLRSTQQSLKNLSGTLSYNSATNVITGTSTNFNYYFSNGDVIWLQANTSNNQTVELQVIQTVNSNTQITLYGPPINNSTASAVYRTAPVILPSQYALYDPIMTRSDGTINGENDNITAIPSSGNNIIASVSAINSGKGYTDGELVTAYLSGGLNPLTIVNPGINYANGDSIIFTDGGVSKQVSGYVTTNTSGSIVSTTYSNGSGSGYTSIPNVNIRSNTGSGAILSTTVSEFNTFSQVTGQVEKAGVGIQPGYWTTTRSFLDSDKYIQDSYFYQDFSYQIKIADTLENYKDILYSTFHTAGTELFGEFYQLINESSPKQILYEPTQALYQTYLSVDSTTIKSDTTAIEVDQDYTF